MAKKSSKRMLAIQSKLIDWYAKHKRDLPWRKTSDPYAIWISEVMLQQTRVDTVIDYWHRFLQTFPTIEILANASEQSVLQQWQGLGYYRRAKYLHKAAKTLVHEHNGYWPRTAQELCGLPGFGPYTAGAVASIAFNEKVPCVDGNVKRVLSRVQATHDSVESAAFELAQCQDPSSLNQSIMELGATLCARRSPKCEICPIESHCHARKTNTIELYPAPTIKKQSKNIWAVSLALQNTQLQYLYQKRTQTGRWEGLWEFPFWEWTHEPNEKEVKTVIHNAFPTAQNFTLKGNFKHLLTHQNISVQTWHANTNQQTLVEQNQAWLPINQNQKPISTLQQKADALIDTQS